MKFLRKVGDSKDFAVCDAWLLPGKYSGQMGSNWPTDCTAPGMKRLPVAFLTLGLVGSFAANFADADTLSLGLSYNLVALTGGINYSGPDIEGGIAAAGNIVFDAGQSWQTLSVGQKSGPNANTPYAIVSGGSISTANGAHITINGGGAASGNAISTAPSSPSGFYSSQVGGQTVIANSGGTLTQGTYWTDSGLSGLAGLAKSMSASYASMSTAGTSTSTTSSQLNLNASSANPAQKVFVFNINASQFSSSSQALWINSLLAGATVVINVSGCSTYQSGGQTGCVMNLTPFLNGNQIINQDFSHVVFNFTDPVAQNLIIDQQLDGLILAPYSVLEGSGDVGGTIWVGSDDSSGEIHEEAFTGATPPPGSPLIVTPEPGTLGLVGAGVLALAGLVRRRLTC
jgi:hypothetical protein